MRLFIILVLLAILFSLGSALRHLMGSRPADSRRMARALTVRISLSVGLFMLLLAAWSVGLIEPHSLG